MGLALGRTSSRVRRGQDNSNPPMSFSFFLPREDSRSLSPDIGDKARYSARCQHGESPDIFRLAGRQSRIFQGHAPVIHVKESCQPPAESNRRLLRAVPHLKGPRGGRSRIGPQ